MGSRKGSSKSVITVKNDIDDFALPPSAQGVGLAPEEDTIEIPAVNATLDHTLPVEYFKQDLLSVIHQLHISKWHRLPQHVAQDIHVSRMSGALTNAIYKVDAPSVVILKNLDLHHHHFPTLLLRVYGPNVESIIDRDYELKILVRLSRQNIGPKLFGCFTNGRIEQFLDNAITLTRDDIRDKKTSARIARRMKELHSGIKLTKAEKAEGPSAWKNIAKWLPAAKKIIKNTNLDPTETEIMNGSFELFEDVVNRYKTWLYKRYKDINDTVVFCHNDTQYGNLLFTSPHRPKPLNTLTETTTNDESNKSQSSSLNTSFSNLSLENLNEIKPSVMEKRQDQNLVVIDFEYSGANPPAFDIANHFSEWMHNYHHPTDTYAVTESDFPTLDQQFNLIYSYILFNNTETDISKLEKEAQILYNECVLWRPTVSVFWGIWAILQNGDKEKDHSDIIEMGPNGEKYKIVIGDDDDDDDEGEVAIVDDDDDDAEEMSGVDTFEYLKYARDKFACFWGDMLQIGLVKKEELHDAKLVKLLPTSFFEENKK